jgi:hypothetical protein
MARPWLFSCPRAVDGPSFMLQLLLAWTCDMTSGEILTYGKALIWFAIPLALAFWELWRLRDRNR